MIRKLASLILGLFIGLTICAGIMAPVSAANEFNKQACSNGTITPEQKQALGCNESTTAPSVVVNIIKVVISILGIVAIVVIVFAGVRFATSSGDPALAKQARDMMVYAIIGLVVALLAFAIVVFVENGISG